MSERSSKLREIRERRAEKRQEDLSSALIRSAALGLALKGDTTPWLAERLSHEQLEKAKSIANEHRLHLEALRLESVEKHGLAPESEGSEEGVEIDDAESAA